MRTSLAVDDSVQDLKLLINMLKEKFTVLFASNGRKAIKIARSEKPDIILLDILMPDMNGFEICRKLKNIEETRHIPVIFLSANTDEDIEASGFEIGGDDFIAKPIRPTIIHARLKNHLRLRNAMEELKRLYSLALDANPMTGLPGNNSVASTIEKSLAQEEATCVIYTDLDNFKAFNDKYGFARGDEVLLFTARILQDALDNNGRGDDFLGHIGGDDFVIVTPCKLSHQIAEKIIDSFDKGILTFYNDEDAGQKCIKSIDRQGAPQTFPIMSISIAGVDLSHRRYSSYIEVNDICAEIKKRAKRKKGSCFYLDQRTPKNNQNKTRPWNLKLNSTRTK